mgnify:CR=1 FL=1
MKIVVCYKNVPEEQEIKVKADHTLDFSKAAWKIGQYDLNAMESATALAAKEAGSEIIFLTVGGDVVDNSKQKKAALSRGAGRLVGVMDPALTYADTHTTASVIKTAIEKIGDVDVVVFGEGSGDIYAQQTGSVAGALLGWATVNGVQGIELEAGKLELSRGVEDGIEILEASLPAAISVTSDINVPRIPSMKDILAAGKKPVEIWSLDDVNTALESVTEVVSILAPDVTERRQIIIEGDSEDNIETLYQYMRKIL